MVPYDSLLKALEEAFLRYPDELLHFGRYFADQYSARSVAVEAVKNDSAVDADNISIPENLFFARDAVNDLLIDRGTDACRETVIV